MGTASAPGQETVCYLVRHCDVDNPDRVIYGHLPDFGLSPRGREQALHLGRFLAERQVRAIYSSPLDRALETAALVQEQLPQPVPIQATPELVEAEFGRYLQGVPYRQIPWRRPRWLVHMVWPGLVPGDESMGAMCRRTQAAIDRGLAEHPGAAFVCISHGDPIQAFWAVSEHRPPWALHRLQCAKGGLLELRYREGLLLAKRYLTPEGIAELTPAAEAEPAAGGPAR